MTGRMSRPQKVLSASEWMPLARAHEESVDTLTKAHLDRHARGEKHPVWDFIFDYYRNSPGKFRRWHPGAGIAIAGACPHANWKYYVSDGDITWCDTDAFLAKRGKTARYVANLLRATTAHTAHYDCFCLHEWAMCYKETPRHSLPLRLGSDGVVDVVDSHDIRCTHYDAFRFFTDAARSLNQTQLTRDLQPVTEQAGCLHATMDLYKWAFKMEPLITSDITVDAFLLACDARILDMQASPYDCRAFGLDPVAVETTEGKAQFVHRQRELARRGTAIRSRLLTALEAAGVDTP